MEQILFELKQKLLLLLILQNLKRSCLRSRSLFHNKEGGKYLGLRASCCLWSKQIDWIRQDAFLKQGLVLSLVLVCLRQLFLMFIILVWGYFFIVFFRFKIRELIRFNELKIPLSLIK